MQSADIVSAQALQVKPGVACAMDMSLDDMIRDGQEHSKTLATLRGIANIRKNAIFQD